MCHRSEGECPGSPGHLIMDEFEMLNDIRNILLNNGEKFPKKHGNWIYLKVSDGFFSMDSWNGAIWHHNGEPEYEYWTGFTGMSKTYLGLSDRSWRHNDPLPLSKDQYSGFLGKIKEVSP